MNPVKWSLKYWQVTAVVTLMLFGVGIHALLKMPRREDPKITIRQGLVAVIYPGATAEQVEDQVTRKIEERLFRFEEVRKDKTYSTSRPNLVIVNVRLEDRVRDTDKFWARLRHDMNELRAKDLPPSVIGPMVNSDFGDTVAVLMAVRGSHYGYRELKDYVERIEDELRTIRAVSKLKRYGEQKEQIYITSSLERLSQYATDPARVIRALQTRNVVPYAGAIDVEDQKVPLNASGLFQTENEIRRVMIDMSPTGQPVYIGDVAAVERRYQDPDQLTRFDGEPCLMLSVEMQEGNNIVEFGKTVREKLDAVKTTLPPDLKIDLIADQPRVVEERISHFIREFGIAIAAVILVTMVLLPFRVALIAALAIPVTVAVTFGIMNAIGIELHQVSISALIVVLGMVVDDAIVIADNYVELLDRKVPREEAAWRSATELAVPVLTATITIIASFLPLLMLSGSVGEFISALPITVAVALSASFVVAMLLTPLLCRLFIHRGLHSGEQKKKKFSVLDLMQRSYVGTIRQAMRVKIAAVVLGVVAFAGGIVLLRFVQEQFFPSAERNQFVVDVWLPEGTRIEATDRVLRRIEAALKQDSLVENYSTFAGQSAPRFYYNVDPQDPATNYGQLLVNTRSEEKTPQMVSDLRRRLASVAPEAQVIVKELQQGEIVRSPVEVRISGDDLGTLGEIGHKVEQILRDTKGSIFVENNFREYAMQLKLDVDNEVANRLGLTNASIATQLAGGFQGAPVTTFWEGDRAVDVLLRLDPNQRQSFDNIRDTYLTSQLTRARVPVREIADLTPQWQPGRIVHRNGVRTMTVGAFFQRGYLASQILNAAKPKIDALALPSGYRITYGGEIETQKDTFREMSHAMIVSLVAIFLVMLFQFRSLNDPWIVMISIPLSLLGAALGLVVTRNPFGFTAFMGIVSLSGIVVRNSIILVDYIHERRKDGVELEAAAMEAGERRLRPIFLTTMAAAIGVIPMIASGSSLWSPLASVIAVGLLCSMVFTLIVVPVVYVMAHRREAKHAGVALAVLGALLFTGSPARAESRKMTLEEAVDTALKGNRLLKLARLKIKEQEGKQQSAKSLFFPKVTNESNLLRIADRQSIPIPMGMLGVYPNIGPIPGRQIDIPLGDKTSFFAFTTFGQPLSQLFKIREGYRVAEMDTAIASSDANRAENEVALKVHEAFFGLLIAQRYKQAAQVRVAAAEEQLRDAANAVEAGTTLSVAQIGRRAALLEARHALLSVENQISDVALEFNDLLGLPPGTEVEPVAPAPPEVLKASLEESITAAQSAHPEVRSAEQTERKAKAALAAARHEYIPDVSAFGQYLFQSGVPLLAQNNAVAGLKMDWKIFDFGQRRGVVHEREALVEQASENLRRIRARVAIEVEKGYRKLDRAGKMVEVAREALELRRESERLASDQVEAGMANQSVKLEASAARSRAEATMLEAELGYSLARAEFERTVGRTPR